MNQTRLNRRHFLGTAFALPFALSSAAKVPFILRDEIPQNKRKAKIKLSCNLYSFNAPLRNGELSLEEVIDICAELGFDAIDPTGYYLTGYPEPPKDSYLYHIKKKAFLQGLDISGTGVRNDFTVASKKKRKADLKHIKEWVEVAAKLDAPVLRIFTGRTQTEGFTKEQHTDWVVEAFKTCVEYGKEKGVMITLQNHNELLKTAKEVRSLYERVDSDWFGLNLDIGSLRQGDPYEEIAALAPLAVTWQIKEKVYRNGKEEKTDLKKIVQILHESGYRGYIPLETLGAGDPKEKLTRFIEEVKEALG